MVLGTDCQVICSKGRVTFILENVCIENTQFLNNWRLINPNYTPSFCQNVGAYICNIKEQAVDQIIPYPSLMLHDHPLHKIMGNYSILYSDTTDGILVDDPKELFKEYMDNPLMEFLLFDPSKYDYYMCNSKTRNLSWCNKGCRALHITMKDSTQPFGIIYLDLL